MGAAGRGAGRQLLSEVGDVGKATVAGALIDAELLGHVGHLQQRELLRGRIDGRVEMRGGGAACHANIVHEGCDRVTAGSSSWVNGAS